MSDLLYAFQRNSFQSDAVFNVETLGQFVSFLSRAGELRCVLVEMDFIYESSDSPASPTLGTLYFTDREFFDDVTNHPYVDVVRAAPQYTRALSGDQLGSYISSIGTLELDNADGNLDFLLSLACDGSQIRFYFGSVNWSVADFKHIFTAIVSKVTAPAFDRISVVLKDTGLLLDKSIGGTSTVGGTGSNADRARPVNFGYIHNLSALVADNALLVYVHSDSGTGTVAQEVRDRGVSVAFTDNADGTFTLTASPDGTITCDVLAEPIGSDNVRVSHAMLFLIGDRAGISALGLYGGPGRTYTTEDVDDYKIGDSLSEAKNCIAILADIIESGNCFWAVKRTGEFTFGRLRLNDIASFGLAEVNVYEDDIDQGSFKLDHAATQYYKYQAYMSRNWSRQTDFASSLSPDEQALYSRPGLFVVQPDAIGTSYADAPELYHKTLAVSPVVDTLLSEVFSVSDVDSLAQWETTRRAIFLPWIEVVTVVVGIEYYSLELGDPVRLFIAPRMGEDDTGVLFQVISNSIRLTDAKVELRLARRNVIQPVPPSWLQEIPIIDETQQEYVAAPPTLTQPETGLGSFGPSLGDEEDPFGWRHIAARVGPHPDVLLWVPFSGGSTTDISIYNRTPSITNDCATLVDGFLHVDVTSASPTSFTAQITYPIDPLPYGGTMPTTVPLTFEGFVKWIASANNTDPYHMFRYSPHPAAPVDVRRYKGSGNAGSIEYNDSGVGIEASASTALAPSGTLYHWAWVIPASGGDDTNRFYINGVQVMTYVTTRPSTIGAGAYWSIGGAVNTNGGAPSNTEIYLGETRVVARNLYPGGTSFTPPTPGNLIVIT